MTNSFAEMCALCRVTLKPSVAAKQQLQVEDKGVYVTINFSYLSKRKRGRTRFSSMMRIFKRYFGVTATASESYGQDGEY